MEDRGDRPGPLVRGRKDGIRRAELVALASEMFGQHGYHGVGMRAIAQRANMQAASLYHHFRGKQELLMEAICVVDRDLVVEQLPVLDGTDSHADRLARLVRRHIAHIGANRDSWRVASRELRSLSPENLAAVQVYRRRYQHRIAEFIAEGVCAGEFGCDDARLTTLAILDMINGINEWFTPDGRHHIDELADRYAALVLRTVGSCALELQREGDR